MKHIFAKTVMKLYFKFKIMLTMQISFCEKRILENCWSQAWFWLIGCRIGWILYIEFYYVFNLYRVSCILHIASYCIISSVNLIDNGTVIMKTDSSKKSDNWTSLSFMVELSYHHNHRLYIFCRKQSIQGPGRRN